MSQMFDRVLSTPLLYKVMIMPRIFQHQKVKPVKLFLTQLIPFLFPMETAETFELIDTIFWLTWKKRSEVLYSCCFTALSDEIEFYLSQINFWIFRYTQWLKQRFTSTTYNSDRGSRLLFIRVIQSWRSRLITIKARCL